MNWKLAVNLIYFINYFLKFRLASEESRMIAM